MHAALHEDILNMSTVNESIYVTPCHFQLNETPKTCKKRQRANSVTDLINTTLFEDGSFDNSVYRNRKYSYSVSKENESGDDSVYSTPSANFKPHSELNPSLFDNFNPACDVINKEKLYLSPKVQIRHYNDEHKRRKIQNDVDLKLYASPTSTCITPPNIGLITPRSSTPQFCRNTKIGDSFEECSPSNNGFDFMKMFSNRSVTNTVNRSSTKLTSLKPVRRAKDRTLLQKLLKLKLLRRIPPNLPLQVSFKRPYNLVSGITAKYSKKLNIFKRIFGKRKVQDKYTKLSNKPSVSSSQRSGNSNSCSSCHQCTTQSHILSNIEKISARLEKIERDVQDLKKSFKEKRTDEIVSLCSLNTPAPPPPPPPPPLPSFSLSSNSLNSNISSKSSSGAPLDGQSNSKVQKILRNKGSFTITADDIKSVKLRKTPAATLWNKESRSNYKDPRFPEISVDMLRSVKLKSNKSRRITDKKRQSLSPYLSRESSGSSPTGISRRLFLKEGRYKATITMNETEKHSLCGNRNQIEICQKINLLEETDC